MIQNAKQFPKRLFGLHMSEGVAEYKEPGKDAFRVYLNQNTIMQMNKSFEGKPVYVMHVDNVDLSNIQQEADGYVVKSFYNAADGKHWVEFMVVSDDGHAAIQKGWKLSNAYVPKSFQNGGEWHGVSYQQEITQGEYEHLAIVPNPRYSESIILTPEQFEKYNLDKQQEIKRIANSKDSKSKGESKMSILQFFKREKIENSLDIESTMVVLPKSKLEKTIAQLVNEADEKAQSKMCNMEDEVMVNDEKMQVGHLVEKFKNLISEYEKVKAGPAATPAKDPEKKENVISHEEAESAALEIAEHEEASIEAAKKKENEDEKKKEKEEGEKRFNALKNAKHTAQPTTVKIELSEDRVARGKARYGRD